MLYTHTQWTAENRNAIVDVIFLHIKEHDVLLLLPVEIQIQKDENKLLLHIIINELQPLETGLYVSLPHIEFPLNIMSSGRLNDLTTPGVGDAKVFIFYFARVSNNCVTTNSVKSVDENENLEFHRTSRKNEWYHNFPRKMRLKKYTRYSSSSFR